MAAHERLSTTAEAVVFAKLSKSSYSRATKMLGRDAGIPKTAVMNKAHAIQIEISFERLAEKKCV